MQFKDYYAVLGVARDAPADEIRKAFRRLARRYHPDVFKATDAESRMKDVNEAYAVLSDPEKRAAYDRLGQAYRPGQEFRPPPDWNAGFGFSGHRFSPEESAGFSDFFEQIFGRAGFAGGASFHRTRGFGQGVDHHASVQLDIEEAFSGASRQLSLEIPQFDAQGRLVRVTRTLNVRIPKGGMAVRVRGRGIPGEPPGDLLLDVRGVLPPAATPRAREFYERMARELAFDPRSPGA